MARVFLALGANVGDRRGNLLLALRWLAPQCRVVAVSSLYGSRAMVAEGAAAGPDFFNAACEVETDLAPEELLALLKQVEHAIGRRPAARWAPRPIDIDILLYDDIAIESADLIVPHTGIAERAFVLAPLAEIAGDVMHPVHRRTIGDIATDIDYVGLTYQSDAGWAASVLG